jgi:glycosyltransferase involved in cell wall biosynthesis
MRARILVVDDGSTRDPSNSWAGPLLSIDRIDRMRLRRNVGHQRAIALGLVWVHGNVKCDRIVVMDSDGEDRPADVPMLLERFEQEGGARVVFAARRRRTESAVFRLFYHAYRAVHVLLTGISVRVGNFSVVPFRALGRLVVASELWNHYAAAVFRSRLPYTTVPLARGERLQGISKMNFPSLVVHGLSAISVFSDIVGARMLAALTGLTLLSAASIGVVIALRLGTGLAIPGWATYTAGLLLVILLQAVVASFLLVFIIVSLRTGAGFLPLRDAAYFVESVDQVWPGP